MIGNLGVVILAAGLSRRMGAPKLLLEIAGRPLLAHVLDTANAFNWGGKIAVIGEPRMPLEQVCVDRGFPVVHNPCPQWGQSSSLRLGLSRLPAGLEGFLFLLGDQPQADTNLINSIVLEYHKASDTQTIIVPSYRGEACSPALFGSYWRKALSRLEGDQGGRQIIKDNPDKVVFLSWDDPMAFYDIDTWEEYEKVREDWESKKKHGGKPDGR